MAKRSQGIPTIDSIATLVTVAFLCELFHASAVWVYERIADGDFQSIKASGKRLITGASVVAYIEKKKAEPLTRDPRVDAMQAARAAKRAARPRLNKNN